MEWLIEKGLEKDMGSYPVTPTPSSRSDSLAQWSAMFRSPLVGSEHKSASKQDKMTDKTCVDDLREQLKQARVEGTAKKDVLDAAREPVAVPPVDLDNTADAQDRTHQCPE